MKKASIILLFYMASLSLGANDKIKVACVGNSITFGAGVVNRTENSYPAQLQTYLGNDYIVKNFGVNGATVLSKGDHPYVSRAEYQASLEFNPDIVFLKLGTNDSKSHNMVYFDGYKSDYKNIIDSYKKLESKPRIILISPVRCYLTDETGISNSRMVEQITPIVEELAYENDIEIIDGYSLFGEEYHSHIMPDRLHPSSIGAGIMADNFYRLLAVEKDCSFDVFDKLKAGEDFDFHGFKGRNYSQDGLSFKVVQPKNPNKKHSWVLHSKLLGHEPQLDQKLLELGFHIAYCDVTDLLGADTAVKKWGKFYKIMTSAGLSKKVILEGMSGGGLTLYNWAAKNPKKVSAIYADAPEPILQFILKAEGVCENMCIKPIRGNEYRAAAGWKNGADWNQVAADITVTLKANNVDILMLGNSITQGFAVNRKLTGIHLKRNEELSEIFEGFSWESAGISGDRTQHLLWRVKNGEYNSANPKYVTIAIGVNNATDDAESVYAGIAAVTEAAVEEFPASEIILFGMLPTAGSYERVEKYNKIINKLRDTKFDDRVLFVDPREHFTDEKGELRMDLYSADLIHIKDEGYKVWAKLIMDSIKHLK